MKFMQAAGLTGDASQLCDGRATTELVKRPERKRELVRVGTTLTCGMLQRVWQAE